MRAGAASSDQDWAFTAISDALLEVIERVDAARKSADGLKRYERQTLDSISRSRSEDPTRPTPEQIEIINGHLEQRPVWDSPNSAKRVPIGTGWEVSTTVRKLHTDGRIDISSLKAADKFYKDYNCGVLNPKVAGRYGIDLAMAGLDGSKTPLSQLAEPNDHEEEFHLFHAKRYVKAVTSLAHKPTAYWLTAVVCEVRVGEPGKIPTLEDVGRAVMGYDNRQRAQAAGATIITTGLDRLAQCVYFTK